MPTLPVRPAQEICIANPDGSAECFDDRRNPPSYKRPSVTNYLCTNSVDYIANEEWVRFVLEGCK